MKASTVLKILGFYVRFTFSYTKIGYWARRTGWSGASVRDYSGQRWLITGASSGLGKAMMHAAASANATVVGVSGNQSKLDAAVAELPDEVASRVTTIATDLSLQSETQKLVDKLLDRGEKFDVLHNNAGMLLNDFTLTSEGRESSFAINVLSHYLLTTGLVDNGAFNDDAIVVNMTSGGMYNVPLATAGLNNTDKERYNGKLSYAFTKRAQVALTDHWNEKYADRSIRFYVTHPGWSKTPGVKTALPLFWKIQNPILRTPVQGADTALWLCDARPPVQEDFVWFDRKPRATHMFDFTKKPQCTVDELVEYFESELAQA